MSKPVYVFYCVQSFTEAYYQLSKEEKDNLWSKVLEGNKGNGVKELIEGCA